VDAGYISGAIYCWVGGSQDVWQWKWLACLPPMLVRGLSYLYLYYSGSQGDFFLDLQLFYWGPCVILAVESANFGAILGEVLVGVYGRQQLSQQLAK
jgi:hypothetical protein